MRSFLFTLCILAVHAATLAAADLAHDPSKGGLHAVPSPGKLEGLIQKLGSSVFEERDGAHRELEGYLLDRVAADKVRLALEDAFPLAAKAGHPLQDAERRRRLDQLLSPTRLDWLSIVQNFQAHARLDALFGRAVGLIRQVRRLVAADADLMARYRAYRAELAGIDAQRRIFGGAGMGEDDPVMQQLTKQRAALTRAYDASVAKQLLAVVPRIGGELKGEPELEAGAVGVTLRFGPDHFRLRFDADSIRLEPLELRPGGGLERRAVSVPVASVISPQLGIRLGLERAGALPLSFPVEEIKAHYFDAGNGAFTEDIRARWATHSATVTRDALTAQFPGHATAIADAITRSVRLEEQNSQGLFFTPLAAFSP